MDVHLTTVTWDFISFNSCWKRVHPSYWYLLIEGSSEVKLPTIWTDGKAEVGRVREEKRRRKKIREEKESAERRCRCAKSLQSRETRCFSMFFQWFVAPEGRKVARKSGRCRAIRGDERWKTARLCGAKHISKSKRTKHTTPGALLEDEMFKNCTLLAGSTFPSQKVQSTPTPEHFWKLRCSKSAVVAQSTFRSQKC